VVDRFKDNFIVVNFLQPVYIPQYLVLYLKAMQQLLAQVQKDDIELYKFLPIEIHGFAQSAFVFALYGLLELSFHICS
jgi:hypothetical protein